MTKTVRFLTSRKGRRGATALEYALVLAFVAVVVVAALNLLSPKLKTAISSVGDNATAAAGNIK
jgi:Flp pilus assembly pilin Flp